MIKARSKKLSILLVLAMLMTMFVGLGTAGANTTTYSCLQVPYLANDTTVGSTSATLGTVVIDWSTLTPGTHKARIILPEGLEFITGSYLTPSFVKNAPVGGNITASIVTGSTKEATIEVNAGVYGATDVRATLRLDNIKVTDSAPAGEAKLRFLNVQGLFPQGDVVIGNVVGAGAANITIIETKTFTSGAAKEVEFTVQESTEGGVKKNENKTLTFKLPRGFEWVGTPTIKKDDGNPVAGLVATVSSDKRTLEINRGNDSEKRSMFKIKAEVAVDETMAKFGDVTVEIAGKNTVVPTSLVIGKYADYGYTIKVENEGKEVFAGRSGLDNITSDEAKLSKFVIEENIAGSLLDGRTIYFELPEGIQFYTNDSSDISNTIKATNKAGGLNISFAPVTNKPNMVKGVISNNAGTAGKVEIEIKPVIAVDYVGDVTVKFSGTAGINDTIKIGKVVAPLKGNADIKEVKIGVQNQPAGTIKISEVSRELLVSHNSPELQLELPKGVSFAKLPKVKVVEGDLIIGVYTLAQGPDGTRDNVLVIPVKSSSVKPATIEVSDVYYSLDRTVPEGDMKVKVKGAAIDRAGITNREVALEFAVANCVTPAPAETVGTGMFKIGSNIYYVGNAAKVMDVAPYIKNARTYVPMRYLGEILGAEVVWNDAARTVTLTKGSDVVVFTIGSTTYTVNGETKTADVAPEISNSRTMLPARFVAEAFGAQVGWDAGTQTVLIQK